MWTLCIKIQEQKFVKLLYNMNYEEETDLQIFREINTKLIVFMKFQTTKISWNWLVATNYQFFIFTKFFGDFFSFSSMWNRVLFQLFDWLEPLLGTLVGTGLVKSGHSRGRQQAFKLLNWQLTYLRSNPIFFILVGYTFTIERQGRKKWKQNQMKEKENNLCTYFAQSLKLWNWLSLPSQPPN